VQWVVKICLATQTHPAVLATKARDEYVSTLGITLYKVITGITIIRQTTLPIQTKALKPPFF
jgi:hypothetical protein